MTKTFCEVLGSDKIWQIAYSACYSLRGGKASDAQPECAAYADAVVDAVCQKPIDGPVGNLESICCNHVRDPWGSDIGLGWLGQLIAADAMCATDCDRIAANTLAALKAAVFGVQSAGNFGSSGGRPLDDVINDIFGNKDDELKIDQIIEAQLKLQMLNVISNMFKPNPYATMAKMMYSMMQPLMMVVMMNVVMNMFSSVV